jgi:hypothetical protein
MKYPGQGYGHLPSGETRQQPFEEIACDSIGPQIVPILGRLELKFSILTTICTVSNSVNSIKKIIEASTEAGRLWNYLGSIATPVL